MTTNFESLDIAAGYFLRFDSRRDSEHRPGLSLKCKRAIGAVAEEILPQAVA